MNSRLGAWVFALALTNLATFYVTFIWHGREGELVNKQEWSVLQSVEVSHRGEKIPQIVAIHHYEGTDWDVVGLPTDDGGTLWMLTNAWGLPHVKTMGAKARFEISESDYQLIRSKLELNDDIDFVLRNAIEASAATTPLP